MKALRVLVAEDDTIVGTLLGELLKEMGHEVCAIEATEADAVAAAVRCRPDLMIIDVRLGDGSGISAVEEILRTGPVSYMFVSGDISSVQVLRPGAVIIRKPYREPDLAQAIQRAIGAGAVRTFVGNLPCRGDGRARPINHRHAQGHAYHAAGRVDQTQVERLSPGVLATRRYACRAACLGIAAIPATCRASAASLRFRRTYNEDCADCPAP